MTGAGRFIDAVQNLHQRDAVLRGGDARFRAAENAVHVVVDLAFKQAVEIKSGRGIERYI